MSTPIADTMRRHPDFPWLRAGDVAGVERALRGLGWLSSGEQVASADPAGEGNMNLTLRVVTSERRFVLKQARPWVEKHPEIPAPWDRSQIEQRFYARVAAIPGVGDRMPRILHESAEARLLAMEDLPDARDMGSLYADDAPTAGELDELADYLAALHAGTGGEPSHALRNASMRALNHEHIFRVPLDPANGLPLDDHEPGLAAAARRLAGDEAFVTRAVETGGRYLEDGRHLVHGDFFPGSWLRTRGGLRVIDPEFAHCGAPEFDLACAVAHLALAARAGGEGERLLGRYRDDPDTPGLDAALLARFAAIEVVRRIAGVAQLPIPPSRGARADLLGRARAAMLEGRHEVLFT